MEINRNLEGFVLENLTSFFFRSNPNSHSVSHDRSPIKKDVNSIWIDVRAGIAQSTQDPSPVGIFSEESGLNQWRMGNRIGRLFGLFLVSGSPDQDFNEFRRPLSIFDHTFS